MLYKNVDIKDFFYDNNLSFPYEEDTIYNLTIE
jgi:hypothetical protein